MTRHQKQAAAREQRFRELIILYALLRKQPAMTAPDQEHAPPEFYFGAHEDNSV